MTEGLDSGAGDVLLDVDDLSCRLSTTRGPIRAVDGVSFTMRPGQCLGVVGESGSGKSVLMRTIMGLQPETAQVGGTVTYSGTDLGSLDNKQWRKLRGPEISMVFQDPMTSLNPVRRVGRQVTDPIRAHLNVSRREARARATELMRQVGIPEPERRLRQYPHELSGGMRQRVGIAIALACEPKLLIADEPTTALDVTVQKQILDLLDSIRRTRHMAMILVTHDMSVVAGRTDDVMVMYAGRVVERAQTTELFDNPRHPYTRALLRAIPRLDEPSHTPLDAIDGHPPDMVRPPEGCRFAARCDFVQERCRHELPRDERPASHLVECHFPLDEPLLAASETGSGSGTDHDHAGAND